MINFRLFLLKLDYSYPSPFFYIFSFAEHAENPWGQATKKDSPTKQVPQKATEEDLYY